MLRVSLESNTATSQDGVIDLLAIECEVLYALNAALPVGITTYGMHCAVYGHNEHIWPVNTRGVLQRACQGLAGKLPQLGYALENIATCGTGGYWRLVRTGADDGLHTFVAQVAEQFMRQATPEMRTPENIAAQVCKCAGRAVAWKHDTLDLWCSVAILALYAAARTNTGDEVAMRLQARLRECMEVLNGRQRVEASTCSQRADKRKPGVGARG